MIHEQFLKVTSQERVNGKLVDVSSFSVCRCGERFDADYQLGAHILHPALPQPGPLPSQEPTPPMPNPPALLITAAEKGAVD